MLQRSNMFSPSGRTNCLKQSMCKIMYMCGWWLLFVRVCVCVLRRDKKHATFHVHSHKIEILYSPWRGCGSWPVLRRNPPHWLSGGQRQNRCLYSRRAFACSCASWRVFRTARGHVCRSREKNKVKGKGGKKVSHTQTKHFKSNCNQHYNDKYVHPTKGKKQTNQKKKQTDRIITPKAL